MCCLRNVVSAAFCSFVMSLRTNVLEKTSKAHSADLNSNKRGTFLTSTVQSCSLHHLGNSASNSLHFCTCAGLHTSSILGNSPSPEEKPTTIGLPVCVTRTISFTILSQRDLSWWMTHMQY